jgi:hypothetical protein
MYQTWTWLTFLHWPYEPQVVQRLLPDSLSPHTFEGRSWVGLTPFLLEDLRTPLAPALPWFTSFPETNLRTYVVGPDGREGLWFFSLDAARLEPVLVARSTYALPYMWSAMGVEREGSLVRYRSRRRWPGPTPAVATVTVEAGDPLAPEELTGFDHYLTPAGSSTPPSARCWPVPPSSTSHGPCTGRRYGSWRGTWSPPPGSPSPPTNQWCSGHRACGPGSAPCDPSDAPNPRPCRRRLCPWQRPSARALADPGHGLSS